MNAQTGILPTPSSNAQFLWINLNKLTIAQLKAQLANMQFTATRLVAQFPDDTLYSVTAFGTQLWATLNPAGAPPNFYDLKPINSKKVMPANGGDLFFYIHSNRADLCYMMIDAFLDGVRDLVEVVDHVVGFKYLDNRDLLGFIEGSGNPQGDSARGAVTLLKDEWADGSFVMAQRYAHTAGWGDLNTDGQEQAIGRSKLESIQYVAPKLAVNAHTSRAVVRDDKGAKINIVRHNMPYATADEKGTFFISFADNLAVYDEMLANMFGSSKDGLTDKILDFVTAKNGAYFFAPSLPKLFGVIWG